MAERIHPGDLGLGFLFNLNFNSALMSVEHVAIPSALFKDWLFSLYVLECGNDADQRLGGFASTHDSCGNSRQSGRFHLIFLYWLRCHADVRFTVGITLNFAAFVAKPYCGTDVVTKHPANDL